MRTRRRRPALGRVLEIRRGRLPHAWTIDVRVQREDRGRAQRHLGTTIAVDLNPPAAGPEVQLTTLERAKTAGAAEHQVRARLEAEGILVLAIRSRP